jgi:hypothetical protein
VSDLIGKHSTVRNEVECLLERAASLLAAHPGVAGGSIAVALDAEDGFDTNLFDFVRRPSVRGLEKGPDRRAIIAIFIEQIEAMTKSVLDKEIGANFAEVLEEAAAKMRASQVP